MDLFFELLQVALGMREKLSLVPDIVEWGEILKEAERQAVVGVLMGGLEKLHDEYRPPKDVLLQWIGMGQMMEATEKLHEVRAKQVTQAFSAVGIKSCVIKGVGLAQLYPLPERRQCGDIDLWVSGDREDVMLWLRSQYKVGEVRWHHVDAHIFDDVQTEIHFHVTWLFNPRNNKRLQKWIDANGLPLALESEKGFCVPPIKFDAVYTMIHAFHHLLETGIGLRHMVDYYYVLTSLHRDERDGVLRTIEALGMKKFLGSMMWVMKNVCGMSNDKLLCEPDEQEGGFLLSEIMAGGNFGHSRTDGKGLNTLSRWFMMVKHYPEEVLWMVPWKIWHWFWRRFNA